MLGLAWYEADTCPGCNQPLSESADPEADEKDYTVIKHICASCYQLAVIQKARSDEPQHGALWQVTKATPAAPREG